MATVKASQRRLLSIVRDQATSYTIFKNYFDLLGETLTKYGLKDKPAQIYNCDKTGMPLEHKIPKVIAAKGTKKVRQCTSGTKSQITVLACASAYKLYHHWWNGGIYWEAF